MAVERLMLSQLYLETFIEFYNLAKRTQQAGIEFEPLVEIAGFDRLSGWITRPSKRLTNVTGDRWVPDYDVDWENPNIRHFEGRILDEDAFIWWNVFIRLSLFSPRGDGYPSLKMRVHPKGYGTEIINIDDFKSLKSEMDYIYNGRYPMTWWGPQLMELCQEWKQFLARDWYPPGLNREMVKILNNIFVFGGNEIPVYISADDWDYFVKSELSFPQKYGQEPWKSDFSPWQWDWAWCDVDALVPVGSLPRTKREYVFTREKIYEIADQGNSADMFARVTEIDALEVLETLLQARNPNPVRSLNYPRGL